MRHFLLTAMLSVLTGDCSPVPEAPTVHHENLILKALRYMQTTPETVDELLSRDYALAEGDTIITHERNAVKNLWPSTQIPYVISSALASKMDDILSGMAMVSEHTCLTFISRTTEEDYLLFTSSNGCSSYVGCIGGPQSVFIGPPCAAGNICHEVLHALGFHHEHTRSDRDEHITILTHNIMEGMEKNFKKREGQTFGLPYDVGSIMHYGSLFFSTNSLPTIVTKDGVKDMGQRKEMTSLDIKRVRQLYNCDDPTGNQTTSSQPPVASEEDDDRR